MGNINNEYLKGQASHVTVMEAEKIIAKSDLKEDIVILWRWSHPKILEMYASQIVEQSKLLMEFLDKLETSKKQAALVINKEGQEPIKFSLSKKGDSEYIKMIAYLKAISKLAVKQPPTTSKSSVNYNLKVDSKIAQAEFEMALKISDQSFEKNDNIRRLLLLTAGPRLIQPMYEELNIDLDEEIQIDVFASYASNLALDTKIEASDKDLYWPGVYVPYLLSQHNLNLNISAIVSDGTKACTLKVQDAEKGSSGYACSETHKHIISTKALESKIKWTISQDEKVLSQFDETPEIVNITDQIALSKLLYASRYLNPLTESMPKSMAAALGFIDSSYSLVALEEDKLPKSEAAQYADQGVPALKRSDIAASGDLTSIATSKWLEDNQPHTLWSYNNNSYGWGREV